ncbi:hypothetical protein Syun_008373 [Stephania yunnanensis]|uniref:Uncharacterized protein n=1 Tax=Stephania yunnanensis TaxID=152371 RepID=A0AAP0KEF2_9MAGN
MNYNDLNREDDHNMKISLLSHHLPCSFPFIASSSTELVGTSPSDHTCLISPFNAQFGQVTPSSSASTTSSDSHNYMSSSTAITTNPSSSTTITDCVDSLSWDYLDTLVSTDLKLPWEDYFQTTQELVI